MVDLPSLKLRQKIPSGHTTLAPVCSPNGKLLYVCNRFNDCVGMIDLKTGEEVASIPVPREPVAAALTADGRTLFVANHLHAGRLRQAVLCQAAGSRQVAGRCRTKLVGPLLPGRPFVVQVDWCMVKQNLFP